MNSDTYCAKYRTYNVKKTFLERIFGKFYEEVVTCCL